MCILIFFLIWLFRKLIIYFKPCIVQLEFINIQGSDNKRGTTILKNNHLKVVKVTLSVVNMHRNKFI